LWLHGACAGRGGLSLEHENKQARNHKQENKSLSGAAFGRNQKECRRTSPRNSWSSKAATKMKSVTTEFTETHGKEPERDIPYDKVFLCDLCVLCGQHKQESDRIDHKEHIEKDDTCLLFRIQLIEIAF
jgi:hypothetical protein